MVTYAQLHNMDLSKLSTAAESAGGLSSTLSTRGGELHAASAIPSGMWSGTDADAAGSMLALHPPALFSASDVFKRGQATLEDLVDSLGKAKEQLDSAHSLVAGTGIVIEADGTVVTPVVESSTQAQHNAELAHQTRQLIDEALRMADDADQSAGDRLAESGGDDSDGGILPWLNGDWRDSEWFAGPNDPGDPGYMESPFEKMTENEWERGFGPLTFKSEHSDGDGLNFSMPWDGKNFGLGISGDPQHTLSAELPSAEAGPVDISGGGVELNDSLVPSLGWETGEDGKMKLTPKVGLPFVSWDTPGVSVDLNAVADGASDAAGGVKDVTGKIPGTPW